MAVLCVSSAVPVGAEFHSCMERMRSWLGEGWHACEAPLHVSVSRTVPLRHHWIEPLRTALQRQLGRGKRWVRRMDCWNCSECLDMCGVSVLGSPQSACHSSAMVCCHFQFLSLWSIALQLLVHFYSTTVVLIFVHSNLQLTTRDLKSSAL